MRNYYTGSVIPIDCALLMGTSLAQANTVADTGARGGTLSGYTTQTGNKLSGSGTASGTVSATRGAINATRTANAASRKIAWGTVAPTSGAATVTNASGASQSLV